MKQVFNPYLPLDQYIPDGEPHLFNHRLYVYGSHDKENGSSFCVLPYEVWSCPEDDLTSWSSKGIAYSPEQDPLFQKGFTALYAPDCVKGKDGRYYLYYAMAGGKTFTSPIHVAVSDFPDGPFEYYGEVRDFNGKTYTHHVTFDPAVINDNGILRLYFGWALAVDEEKKATLSDDRKSYGPVYSMLFGKTEEEIKTDDFDVMGAFEVELEDDMLTVKGSSKKIVEGQFFSKNTGFEGHAFFEGSSIRKWNGIYYFIYSSEKQHELCYASSRYPDRDFVYRGTLISNGDIGYHGRTDSEVLNVTGNNHGSIEKIGKDYYVFYHRQTHLNTYSRQGCAEKIMMDSDGLFHQTEMTSCGLNGGPLKAEGIYPAVICCNLTDGTRHHAGTDNMSDDIPHIDNQEDCRYIASVRKNTLVGYKYFHFGNPTELKLKIRGSALGVLTVQSEKDKYGEVRIFPSEDWKEVSVPLNYSGTTALYLEYHGSGSMDILSLEFSK